MMRVMDESKPAKSRVNLDKQMAEIVRLRQEMRAKPPEQRKTTTRAVAPPRFSARTFSRKS